ncbi:MAG: fructose-1,6-bisphosphatase [Gemella sp.]|nr:fructose-1,6-bisphosphatase [Gemella sp.]
MKHSNDYLKLLAKQFPNKNAVISEIINLESILVLPKGTEHFISDIHGEYDVFDHILRNGSGVIKEKLREVFGSDLSEERLRLLSTVIYYPEEKLVLLRSELSKDGYNFLKKDLIRQLLDVVQVSARKYTRSKTRKLLPKEYAYIIEELIYKIDFNKDKETYYDRIVDSIFELGVEEDFIVKVAYSIQKLTVNHLHIVGDIYDRGPFPDKIMDRLMDYHSVDIQWGNHDILWIGASCGDLIAMANVLRICARYDNLDIIEDRYGISLRSLVNFSDKFYAEDECKEFRPKLVSGQVYQEEEILQIARMHKAIAIIQFKLEHSVISKHPEFNMESRLLLDKIDFDKKEVEIAGVCHPMLSCDFPTVDKENPYQLTKEEEELIYKLRDLFVASDKLKKHMNFMINKGAMYKLHNGNLLLHGCMPVDKDGNFQGLEYGGKYYSGKDLLTFFDEKIRKTFYGKEQEGDPIFLYLWQGSNSSLFGKKDMTTFERYFLGNKDLHTEVKNAYYKLREDEVFAKKLLLEFGLDETGHIINGHTPVKAVKGEDPIKANGRVIVIDGGMSKAYNKTTGHGGYTLTYNSYGLQLMKHDLFVDKADAIKVEKDIISTKRVVDRELRRKRIKDTDVGKELIQQIVVLKELLQAYQNGDIAEL